MKTKRKDIPIALYIVLAVFVVAGSILLLVERSHPDDVCGHYWYETPSYPEELGMYNSPMGERIVTEMDVHKNAEGYLIRMTEYSYYSGFYNEYIFHCQTTEYQLSGQDVERGICSIPWEDREAKLLFFDGGAVYYYGLDDPTEDNSYYYGGIVPIKYFMKDEYVYMSAVGVVGFVLMVPALLLLLVLLILLLCQKGNVDFNRILIHGGCVLALGIILLIAGTSHDPKGVYAKEDGLLRILPSLDGAEDTYLVIHNYTMGLVWNIDDNKDDEGEIKDLGQTIAHPQTYYQNANTYRSEFASATGISGGMELAWYIRGNGKNIEQDQMLFKGNGIDYIQKSVDVHQTNKPGHYVKISDRYELRMVCMYMAGAMLAFLVLTQVLLWIQKWNYWHHVELLKRLYHSSLVGDMICCNESYADMREYYAGTLTGRLWDTDVDHVTLDEDTLFPIVYAKKDSIKEPSIMKALNEQKIHIRSAFDLLDEQHQTRYSLFWSRKKDYMGLYLGNDMIGIFELNPNEIHENLEDALPLSMGNTVYSQEVWKRDAK